MFGLNEKGFNRKRYPDVVDSLRDRATDTFGENINLNNNSFLGMLINVTAWAISLIWELAENIYHSKFVDYAEGSSLDLATRNSGISRRGVEKATGKAAFTGDVPIGLLLSSDDVIFRTTERGKEVSIEAIDGGVSSNLPANAIDEIVTPIPDVKLESTTETTGGRDIETDPELRVRFFSSLGSSGASTVNSIIAELLKTEGVVSARVEEVVKDDYFIGIRPILLGGTEEDIAAAILNKKALGIKTFGESSGVATASNGQTFTINFDYATKVIVNVNISLTTGEGFPPNGKELVAEEVTRYINNLNTDEDVIYPKLTSVAFNVSGILDVDVDIARGEEPMGKESIPIGSDEVARADEVVVT